MHKLIYAFSIIMVFNMHYVPKNNYESIMYDKRKELLGYLNSIMNFVGLSYVYDELIKVSFIKYIVNICIFVYKYFLKPYFNFFLSLLFFYMFYYLIKNKKLILVAFVCIIVILLYGLDRKTPIRLMS